MTVSDLSAIKAHYETMVLKDLHLKCPSDKSIKDYRLVTPMAHIGWIPPRGIIPSEADIAIPCMVLSVDNKLSSDEETIFKIRISVAVFEPGKTDDKGCYTPNLEGYEVLLNFMDRLEACTLKNPVIAERFLLVSEIEMAMYEEQPYPYWYGYLKFSLKKEAYPVTRYAELL